MRIITLIVIILANISLTFSQQLSESQKAEIAKYQQQAIEDLNGGKKSSASANYRKIAEIYWNVNEAKEAISYFKKCISIEEELNNKNALATYYEYVAILYDDLNDKNKSYENLQKSNEYVKKLGNNARIFKSLNNLALIQIEMGKNKEAVQTYTEALGIGNLLDDKPSVIKIYNYLIELYKKLGDSKKVTELSEERSVFEKMISKDEIKNIKNLSQSEIEKANIEKNQSVEKLDREKLLHLATKDSLKYVEGITMEQRLEIEVLSKDKKIKDMELAAKENELKSANKLRNMSIAILLIVLLFSVLLFRQIHGKIKANKQLATQNVQLYRQKEEIKTKNTLLAEQNLDLAEKNQEIERQKEEITKSIYYAEKIQKAILPSKKAISCLFPNSMIFYKPRDIVSGDFYWFSRQENLSFFAVVDCTGHSVPGAFMSMIGNTLLNELVNENKILDPAKILSSLNDAIIKTLRQQQTDEDISEDGMDLTICMIDKMNNTLTFACANHTVYLFKGNELESVTGDIYSIGGSLSAREKVLFNNHTYQLNEISQIYMFTDGYADQFGGQYYKKYMGSQFKQLITKVHEMPMDQQYEELAKEFNEWNFRKKQTDDILVLGLKLN